MTLKVANSSRPPTASPSRRRRRDPPPGRAKPGSASYIYRVDRQGYVTRGLQRSGVFLCLAAQDGRILVGAGNNAQLYSVDPEAERHAVLYEDEKATQITA
jgi:hypothetical protein